MSPWDSLDVITHQIRSARARPLGTASLASLHEGTEVRGKPSAKTIKLGRFEISL